MNTSKEVAPWIEWLARVGYVAKALLYATIGALAAMAAFRAGGGTEDTRGAMGTWLQAPLGRVLLAAMAIGLLGYAVWRVVEAVLDPERRGTDAKALAVRAGLFLRGAGHGVLAFSAARMALNGSSSSGDDQRSEQATETAFTLPAGEWLVWAVAIGIAAYGGYQIYRAVVAKIGRHLDRGEMSREAGRWVVVVSRVGLAARGIVFMAIAWLLASAARQHDPSKAGGIEDALGTLQDFGRLPFALIALGLVAYGGHQLLNARYRRIKVR